MKSTDMRAGLRVIINSQVEGGTKDYMNRVGTLSQVSQDLWVVVFDLIDGDRYTRSSVVLPHEIDLLTEKEIPNVHRNYEERSTCPCQQSSEWR